MMLLLFDYTDRRRNRIAQVLLKFMDYCRARSRATTGASRISHLGLAHPDEMFMTALRIVAITTISAPEVVSVGADGIDDFGQFRLCDVRAIGVVNTCLIRSD